ncbi:hypothetical protein GCM10010234_07420 [Streptomyces hawaiiensis]
MDGQSRLATDAIQTPRISEPGAAPPRPLAADARGIIVKADSAATANALRETRPIRMPQKAADPPGHGSLRGQHARCGPRPPRSIIDTSE